jgi:two-component system cell cycle response regulator
MSVGVDAIDNDHRRLLETINEINDAITAGKTADVIEEIFSRLERYVVEHFTREEALMEQSGFQELEPHKRQHQKFVGRVPQLKAKLLSADTMEVALEVSLFLTNWLMNHVIMEDISYAQSVHDAGLSDHDRRTHGLLGRFTEWAGRNLVLRRRIYLSALVPITGLLMLIGSMFIDHYREYSEMRQLLGLTDLMHDINALSHTL